MKTKIISIFLTAVYLGTLLSGCVFEHESKEDREKRYEKQHAVPTQDVSDSHVQQSAEPDYSKKTANTASDPEPTPTSTPTPTPTPTADIVYSDLAESCEPEIILYLANNGYLNAVLNPEDEAGYFCPDKTVSRIEFISMILYGLGLDISYEKGEWLNNKAEGFLKNSVLTQEFQNSEEEEIYMSDPIPRYEMALFIYKCIENYRPNDSRLTVKYDKEELTKQIKDYTVLTDRFAQYEDSVLWAYANGIIRGYGDHTFRPDNLTRRDQAAVILYRILFPS